MLLIVWARRLDTSPREMLRLRQLEGNVTPVSWPSDFALHATVELCTVVRSCSCATSLLAVGYSIGWSRNFAYCTYQLRRSTKAKFAAQTLHRDRSREGFGTVSGHTISHPCSCGQESRRKRQVSHAASVDAVFYQTIFYSKLLLPANYIQNGYDLTRLRLLSLATCRRHTYLQV